VRRLHELRLCALEGDLGARLCLGHPPAVVAADVERLVTEHPLREQLWQLLISALYRDRRQGEALAAYDRARRVLAAALGVDPGPELRALHARVLAQDPELGADPPTDLPSQLRPSTGPFVGRAPQLAALRDAWRRAQHGAVTIAVRGPRGAGSSRLAAELALHVARERAPVLLLEQPPAPLVAAGPGLTVLDRPAAPVRPAAGVSGLVVALVDPATEVGPGVELVDLTPLVRAELRDVVATYVDPDELDVASGAVLAESAGWPGAVHVAAQAWARRATSTRVQVAAASTLRTTAELTAARAALSDGVAHLRELDARSVAVGPPSCPWRGLLPYDVEDGRWFAGRERLVVELVARLAGSPLVAVVGDSGSGKSSLISAGLLAALATDALPGSGSWRRVVMRPGEHPMRELALTALDVPSPPGEVGAALERMLRGADDGAGGGTRCTVLVVDQLEEVWTACGDPGERQAFLTALAELAAAPQSSVRLVLALRADFVGQLAGEPALATAVSGATLLVHRPTAAELRRAVEVPAARAGVDLDVGLVDALVGDAGDEPGVLPLLSTALSGLWEHRQGQRLTLEAYVARGGLSGAVAQLADEAVAGLDEAERCAVRVLLLRLAGTGDADRITRRRVPLAELAELPDPRVRLMADALAAARLLTVSNGTVEVAHEALFREWPLLRGWLEEDLAGRGVLRRVTRAAAEWDTEGRDASLLWAGTRLAAGMDAAAGHPQEVTALERAFLDAGAHREDLERRAAQDRAETASRQNARLRRLLGVLAVVLVVALVAGSLAVVSRQQAVEATTAAEARRLAAAAVNEDHLDLALLQAVEAARADPGPETHGALLALLARVPDVVTQVRTRNRYLGLASDAARGVVYLRENEPRVTAVDADSGATRWTADLPWPVDALAPHPQAGLLATASPGGRLQMAVLDPATGRERWRLPVGSGRPPGIAGGFGPEAPLAVLTDGRVAVASRDHLVLVDPAAERVVGRLSWGVPVEPAGLVLLSAGRVLVNRFDGPTLLLHLRTGAVEQAPLRGWASSVSPDGGTLATAYDEDDHAVLQLVDTRSLRPSAPPAPLPLWMDSDAWAADGATLVVASDGVLQLRDGRTGALRRDLRGHSGSVFGLAFVGADSSRLWSAGRDGTAFLWDTTGRQGIARTAAAEVGTYLGDVAADGDTAVAVAYGGGDETNLAYLVDAATGERLRRTPLPMPQGCDCRPWAVAMAPDGRTAMAGLEHLPGPLPAAADRAYDDRGSLVLWDVPDGRVRTEVLLPWPVWGVAVTPDGRRAVVNGTGGWAVVDLDRGRLASAPTAGEELEPIEVARSAAVSPDGRLAAVGRAGARWCSSTCAAAERCARRRCRTTTRSSA
jgi:WD40 repeat protein